MRAFPGLVPTVFVLALGALPALANAGGDAPETTSAAPASAPAAAPAATSTEGAAAAEAQALADAGKFKEAEAKARAAVKADTTDAASYNVLGFALRKQGKNKEAVEAYRKALAAKPDFPQAKEYLAIAHLGLGNVKAAKALHAELKGSHPDLAAMIEAEAKRLKRAW